MLTQPLGVPGGEKRGIEVVSEDSGPQDACAIAGLLSELGQASGLASEPSSGKW